jgi:hypothetical protein
MRNDKDDLWLETTAMRYVNVNVIVMVIVTVNVNANGEMA